MFFKLNFPRSAFFGLVILLLCQLLVAFTPAPVLARIEAGESTLNNSAAEDTFPGLKDITASISADNIVREVAGLTRFSRCMNAPTHDDATNLIQERVRAQNLTPIMQSFTSNAPGLRVSKLQNVVVRIPGTNPRAVHMLTAHYDSSPNRFFPPQCDANAPGANDNGSGVAVLLELARLFGQNRTRFSDDIELVFFDGEEFGYLGSEYFVQSFDSNKAVNPNGLPIGAVINLDMVGYSTQKGNGKVWAVAQPGASLDLARQGSDIAAKYAPGARYNTYTIGDLFPVSRDPNRQSDHSSFWRANKGAAIFLTEDVADAAGADPRYHTPGDTLNNPDGSMRLDPALMADSARVALAIVGIKAGPQPNRFFANLNPLFERNWSRADRPVLVGSETGESAGRSWLWGPRPNQLIEEPYEDAPGGKRQVAYFDKARMELTNPIKANVTNGLLVRELATGALQLGDSKFIEFAPSQVPVAGDPNQQGQNPDSPTYASFKALIERGAAADNPTAAISATLDKSERVGTNNALASYARNVAYIPNTGHNIPDVFWNWFQSQGRIYDPINDKYTDGKIFDWLDTVGFPITEPYWVHTRIAGKEQNVLVQLFERRVLTYNPANDSAFRVEMGNVGLHYYSWRYQSNN